MLCLSSSTLHSNPLSHIASQDFDFGIVAPHRTDTLANPYDLKSLQGLGEYAVGNLPKAYLPTDDQSIASSTDDKLVISPFKKTHPCHLLLGGSRDAIPGYLLDDPTTSPLSKKFMERWAGPQVTNVEYKNGSPYKARMQIGEESIKMWRTNKGLGISIFSSEQPTQVSRINNQATSSSQKLTSASTPPSKKPRSSLPLKILREPTFPVFTRYKASIVLTLEKLALFIGVRDEWEIDQKQAMGGMSATQAARCAGLPEGNYEWLHIFAFSMGGFDGIQPNEPQNLIIGTKAANGHHETFEGLAKSHVTNHRSIVVSIEIEQDPKNDAKWHVFKKLKYQFYKVNSKDLSDYQAGRKTADEIKGLLLEERTIDLLDPTYACRTDQGLLQKREHIRELRHAGVTDIEPYVQAAKSATQSNNKECKPTPKRRREEDEWKPFAQRKLFKAGCDEAMF